MTLYKLLIAEDERWEREGLLDFLDWEALGVGIVGAARDGVEGLEMALALTPDIVITDIRMPGMDGLEMARKIKERLPETVIVVLTGFSDFEYARRALQTQVSHYVLKPVEEGELLKAVTSAVDECAKAQRKRLDAEELKAAVERHRGLAMEKLIADALEGRLTKDRAQELRRADGFEAAEGPYTGLAVAGASGCAEADVRRAVGRPCLAAPWSGVPGGWKLIVAANGAEAAAAAKALPGTLTKPGGLLRPEHIVVGAGREMAELTDAWTSVRDARSAAEYASFWGMSGVVSAEEVERETSQFYAGAAELLQTVNLYAKQVVFGVGALDEASAAAALERLFDAFAARRGAGTEYVRNFLTSLYFELSLLAGDGEGAERETAQLPATLKECRKQGLAFVKQVVAAMSGARGGTTDEIVSKVNRLIETNYNSTEFSLAAAAAEVFLSPNYLGALYKKATGRTFHERLTEWRMTKAKELLATTPHKVARVAQEVGIPNASYFSTVFKNMFGMTPGEYQERIRR